MKKIYLISLVIVALVVVGILGVTITGFFIRKPVETEIQCEITDIIYYYADWCSWCRRIAEDGTISKLEGLGIIVNKINVDIGPILHEFGGVPTFVMADEVYSGYRTFDQLKELLKCKTDSTSTNVTGFITIALSELSENAKWYEYNSKDVNIRYFTVKASDGNIKTAFDECDICYRTRKGYRQEGNYMVCNNCGNIYPIIGLGTENKNPGGCWPGYLPSSVDGENVIIKISDLESGRWRFV